jgi:hypothetical protein
LTRKNHDLRLVSVSVGFPSVRLHLAVAQGGEAKTAWPRPTRCRPEGRGHILHPSLGVAVPLEERVKFEPPGKEIRGVGRLHSQVRVAIEGIEGGQAVRAEGNTKDISARGCLAVVPRAFAVGQKVRVVNLVNRHASDAYLIWRGHESPAAWELGIELQCPMADFWGLDF